ncbi:MAG: TonB-dependent receptor [Rudaea sp.]|uniref:TonB-dependent receptor n=1 Tax=Rudaea sp. TaxID=2136325 RepID=UPI0039E3CA5D
MHSHPLRRKTLFLACAAAFGLVSIAAAADDATDDKALPAAKTQPETTQLGNVVVTAQRREQRLVDVPIAVTAIDTRTIERLGVSNVSDIGGLVPGVQINQTIGNTYGPLITMRGISPSGDTNLERDQPVGIYIDGVPVSKSTGAAFDTVDLQSVEVLRGPQGTLYGKNTVAGAVNLVTRQPTGEFGGYAEIGYGQWDRYRERLALNLPTFDMGSLGTLKTKIAISAKQGDGAYDNYKTNGHFGDVNLKAARFDALWEPNEKFSALYAFDVTWSHGTPDMLAMNAIGPYMPAALKPLVAPYVVSDRPDGIWNDSAVRAAYGVNGQALTLKYDLGESALGDVQLKSISSQRTMFSRSGTDFDGTPLDLLRIILNNDYTQWSQEFQVLGKTDRVHYTLGLFYLHDSWHVYNPRWNFQFGGNAYDANTRGGDDDSTAGYGQFSWTPPVLDDRLEATFGIRWTRDERDANELLLSNSAYLANPSAAASGVFARAADGTPLTRSGQAAAGARPGAGGIGPSDLYPLYGSDSWSRATPEFNLSYKIDPDWNIYGRIANGYKAGGINNTASTNAAFNAHYDPEKLTSYEIGSKGVYFDHRLQLNLAAYHTVYKDFQAGVFVPALITTNIINAGEAKFDGFEVEAAFRPVDNFTLNLGYGRVNQRYTDFVLPSGQDVTHTYLIPLSPKSNYQIGAVYSVPLDFASLEASLNYSWRDKQYTTITPDPTSTLKAYGLLDARLALTNIRFGEYSSLEVALWGKNLTNEKYWVEAINLSVMTIRQWGDPRSAGIEARLRF